MSKHVDQVKAFYSVVSNIVETGLEYPEFFEKICTEKFKLEFMGISCEFDLMAQFYNDLTDLLENYIEDMGD